MSGFFKSKHKLTLALSALFVAVTLLVGTFAYYSGDMAAMANKNVEKEILGELSADVPEEETEADVEAVSGDSFEDMVGEVDYADFNVPAEMRGTFLIPGKDFLKTKDTSEETIRSEIDAAFATARDLTINAVIVDTTYGDQVIYQSRDANEASSDFDILAYIVSKAREESFYTYTIFDASLYDQKRTVATLTVGAGVINKLSTNLGEFAEKYGVDGILIDGYQTADSEESYSSYLSVGGGIGFGNFMRQSPAAIVKTAAKAIRQSSPSTQVGLLADAVWENQSANEEGSATEAAYTSLSGGNADTKAFVEKGFVDFVAVKAYSTTDSQSEPFGAVVSWWADLARRNDIPLYVVHASDKVGSGEAGWGSSDQLVKQMMEASEVSGFRGSIFNSLQPLSVNSSNVGADIAQVYKEEVAPEQVLAQLEMTKPAQTTYTTSEPNVTFTGASDPDEPVTINDQKIETDASGYFTVQMKLSAGLNNFTIKHKDKTLTYAITRKIEVLSEASPMGSITVEGGMTVTITAIAYEGADVYATVGGQTIPMSIDDSVEDEQDRDGSFRIFTGEYTAPAATGEVQNVGGITVYASFDGESNSIQCGSITVNKKAKMEDGVAVRVVADQAMTYPPGTSNNVPSGYYYPLPRGAMDYAVGDEITYTKDKKTYTYTVLASGLRVESKDITPVSDDYPSNNAISGLSVKAEDGYTYITLKTAQKVSYLVKYDQNGMSFTFNNTAKVPGNMTLSKNPMFTGASWNGTTLTLSFVKQNGFMGYKGYYDDSGNLILRFNNPPSSISGARIAIDPGHGGGDQGASGFLAEYPEKVLTRSISEYLAAELESRGATVNLMDNAGIEGQQRKEKAEAWNADILISVHCNAAPNASATGTEVYLFQSFNSRLATAASKNVSAALNTTNRGAKASYYHVSLSSQMQSVLVECGFLTNKGEYEKLLQKGNQKAIAVGIADAVSSTIKGTYTGSSATGSESTGASADPGDPAANTTASGKVEAVYLRDTLSIANGKTATLTPTFYPDEASSDVTWKSSDTSVVTVENGKITAKKEGTADITATTKDGGHTAVCEVTVQSSGYKGTEVSGVTLSDSELVLGVGAAYNLSTDIDPADADDTSVTWKSSKEAVATVSASGKVTAVKEGEATITVTTNDGSKKATCKVTVSGTASASGGNTADSGIALSSAEDAYFDYTDVSINPGNGMRLEIISETGEVIKGADFQWKSSDTAVVTVDNKGYITAKKNGEANITATGGGFELECTVTVTNTTVKATGITLDKTEASVLRNKTLQLKATVTPSNASNKGVGWSSSDSYKASVDQNGLVTAKKPGTVTITVKTKDGNYSAKCTVTITSSEIAVDWIDLDETLELRVGETDQLQPQISPANATDKTVTWTSSSANTVSVDASGNIKALRTGRATITCTSADGSASATCEVTVVD